MLPNTLEKQYARISTSSAASRNNSSTKHAVQRQHIVSVGRRTQHAFCNPPSPSSNANTRPRNAPVISVDQHGTHKLSFDSIPLFRTVRSLLPRFSSYILQYNLKKALERENLLSSLAALPFPDFSKRQRFARPRDPSTSTNQGETKKGK